MEKIEIRFRAWDELRQQFIDAGDIDVYWNCDNGVLTAHYEETKTADWRQLDIEQFNGRKDINGSYIFDGDIITHGESIRQVMQVDCRWCAKRVQSNESILLCFATNPKVLGNIHQNPELLTQ